MSLGGPCPFGWCFLLSSMKTAVDAAVESGVTIVVAGGNSNDDACGYMPAFVPSAITVGSTDSLDARSSFSNYGSCTKMWAPGSAITSASHEDDTGAKTYSGTSMACPHVAGGAALVLEQYPEFSAPQVLEKLYARAATNYITDLKSDDVNKMLYIASDAPPPEGDVPPAPEPEASADAYSTNSGKIIENPGQQFAVHTPSTHGGSCAAVLFSVGTASSVTGYDSMASALTAKGFIVAIVDPEMGFPFKNDVDKLHDAYSYAKDNLVSWSDGACGSISKWLMGGHSAGGGTAHKVLAMNPSMADGIFSIDAFTNAGLGEHKVDLPSLHWGFDVTTCFVTKEDAAAV